jgi:DNA-binding LacI/PurR family transcriptional regulator/GAF domain-containing protein
MNPKTPNAQDRRPTIGLLVTLVEDANGAALWTGVVDAARDRDVNLICFPGRELRNQREIYGQCNIIFELPSAESVDGLIIWASSIGMYVTQQEMQDFCRHYNLPAVTVGAEVEGFPSVLLDSYTPLRETIMHLIESHGRRYLAFLRGPRGHREAEQRYQAYADALKACNLPLDPNLVVGPIAWDQGAKAVQILLDQRKLRPSVDFDAIVGSSDLMALNALEVLQERGIRVPNDAALVGFDNRVSGRFATPPLTTASNEFHERGRRAVEMLLALLRGKDVPEKVTVPGQLILRQSCGCLEEAVVQASALLDPKKTAAHTSKEPFQTTLAARREEILATMSQAMGNIEGAAEQTARLWDAFIAEMGQVQKNPSGTFIAELEAVLRQGTMTRDGDVTAWHAALSALRCQVLPYLVGNEAARLRAEDLWQQARTLIGKAGERKLGFLVTQEEQRSQEFLQVGQTLATTSNVENLTETLTEELAHLEIPRGYLALYEDPQMYSYPKPAPEQSRLVLAYNDKDGQIELEAGGVRFPTHQLLPEDVLPQDTRYSLIAKPIFFQKNQWGFALFETNESDTAVGRRNIYEALCGEISSAMHGVSLIEQVESRLFLIQTAVEVSRVASAILDTRELIYRVVELVRERFDLYYVGLFLVEAEDETEGSGKWAYLQAGTGQAGRKMTKQRHRLKVGGESMIGQCIATGQPRVALDVGQEAAHFSNPLLPETRSELALPLVSRGEAIGALTIQSSKEAAFTEEAVATFQLMAGLLANTIENTRLFNQSQEALKEVESFQRLYVRDAWSRHISKNEP